MRGKDGTSSPSTAIFMEFHNSSSISYENEAVPFQFALSEDPGDLTVNFVPRENLMQGSPIPAVSVIHELEKTKPRLAAAPILGPEKRYTMK